MLHSVHSADQPSSRYWCHLIVWHRFDRSIYFFCIRFTWFQRKSGKLCKQTIRLNYVNRGFAIYAFEIAILTEHFHEPGESCIQMSLNVLIHRRFQLKIQFDYSVRFSLLNFDNAESTETIWNGIRNVNTENVNKMSANICNFNRFVFRLADRRTKFVTDKASFRQLKRLRAPCEKQTFFAMKKQKQK